VDVDLFIRLELVVRARGKLAMLDNLTLEWVSVRHWVEFVRSGSLSPSSAKKDLFLID